MSISSPACAGTENTSADHEKWSVAVRQLGEALRLLDESNAPPEVGADLSMAIDRLQKAIQRCAQGDC